MTSVFSGLAVRFKRAVLLGLGVSLMLAVAYVLVGIDLQGNAQFLLIDRYVFTFAGLVGGLLAVSYWWRYGDVSETVAFALVIVWGLASGLVDVLVYVLLGEPIPDVLPWLDGSHIGQAAHILGFDVVTRTALFSVIVVSGLLVGVLVWWLYRLEGKGGL